MTRPKRSVSEGRLVMARLFDEVTRQGLSLAQLERSTGVAYATLQGLRSGRIKYVRVGWAHKIAYAVGWRVQFAIVKPRKTDAPGASLTEGVNPLKGRRPKRHGDYVETAAGPVNSLA